MRGSRSRTDLFARSQLYSDNFSLDRSFPSSRRGSNNDRDDRQKLSTRLESQVSLLRCSSPVVADHEICSTLGLLDFLSKADPLLASTVKPLLHVLRNSDAGLVSPPHLSVDLIVDVVDSLSRLTAIQRPVSYKRWSSVCVTLRIG